MNKKEVKKRLGLSDENFLFYVDMGKIRKTGRDEYEYDNKLTDQILEKSTVFKYYFDDDFYSSMKEFAEFVKYTSKIKHYTPEEIKKFEKNRKKDKKNEEE